MNVVRDRQEVSLHPGVDECQIECRSDGVEGTADGYRGLEGGEAGVGDEGQGVGGVEGKGR